MSKVSLAEIMGSKGADAAEGLSLKHLPDLLGDAMPEMPLNAIGRHRLITALKGRFGHNYRNIPGVRNIVSEFDSHIAFEAKVAQMKQIKYKPTKGA